MGTTKRGFLEGAIGEKLEDLALNAENQFIPRITATWYIGRLLCGQTRRRPESRSCSSLDALSHVLGET